MIEYKDMHWEMDRLYYGKKDTSVRLVRDEKHDHMYWIEWNFLEPQRSVNFYNIANAKDNARVLYMGHHNSTAERGSTEPVETFK